MSCRQVKTSTLLSLFSTSIILRSRLYPSIVHTHWVKEPKERENDCSRSISLSKVVSKSISRFSTRSIENVENVGHGDTSESEQSPLVARLDESADQTSYDHDEIRDYLRREKKRESNQNEAKHASRHFFQITTHKCRQRLQKEAIQTLREALEAREEW